MKGFLILVVAILVSELLVGCSTLDREPDPIDTAIGEFIAGELTR